MTTGRERNNRLKNEEDGARRGTPKMFCKAKFLGDNGQQAPRSGPIRGYTKISDAAKAFNFDFKGKVVLDIGSSTGGFTEYALEKGAKKVIAIEKGTNQMMKPLRFDPRIDLHEKTDIFDVIFGTGDRNVFSSDRKLGQTAPWDADDPKGRAPLSVSEENTFGQDPFPDVILADVSFISLTKILKYAKSHLADKNTEFLVMLKPQFEAKDYQLKNGIVKNETIRREIIKNFESWLKTNRFVIVKKKDNELKGKTGNTERFYYLMLEK